MLIKIIGAGCPACQQLETDVRQWLMRSGVEAQVERIVMMGYHYAQLDRVLREACGGTA